MLGAGNALIALSPALKHCVKRWQLGRLNAVSLKLLSTGSSPPIQLASNLNDFIRHLICDTTLAGFGYFETVLAKPRTGGSADIGEKRRSKFTVARSRPPCWAHPSCPFWPA